MAYTPRGKSNDSPPVDPLDDGNIEADFGDGRYVTDDMLIRYNRNIMFLKDKAEMLEDMTDPELRKRLSPLIANEQDSYGMDYDSGLNIWEVSNSDAYSRNDHFLTTENIDTLLTTAYVNTTDGRIEVPKGEGTEVLNTHCKGPWGAYAANAYWYIGYKRGKNYWASPEWMEDSLSADMPTVARGQVFKATATGKISKITVRLERKAHAEDDIIMELRSVSPQSKLGKPTSNVIGRVRIDNSKFAKTSMLAFPFPPEERPTIVSGKYYFWCLRSPFTSYNNHYGVGGWGKNCNADPYTQGDAFTSFDNCQSWIRHGRNENIPYREGKYAPQDFGFIVHTVPLTSYVVNTDFWAYFNIVKTNPIKSVTCANSQTLNGGTITLEVSDDFNSWTEVNAGNGWMVNYTEPYPTRIWVRAKLRTPSDSATPYLDQLNIVCDCDKAMEGLLRTKAFTPRYEDPLGASIWSKLNAPVETIPIDDPDDPEVDVKVDIVRTLLTTDLFDVTSATTTVTLSKQAAEPLKYVTLNAEGVITELSEYKDFWVDYSLENPVMTIDGGTITTDSVLSVEYQEIWLKDIEQNEFPLKTDLFDEHFTTAGTTVDFKLRVSPVEPLREVFLDGDEIFEGTDFDVNYLTNILTLRTIPSEDLDLEVKYTPNLTDHSLEFIYRVTRPSDDWNVQILPPYFEVRV